MYNTKIVSLITVCVDEAKLLDHVQIAAEIFLSSNKYSEYICIIDTCIKRVQQYRFDNEEEPYQTTAYVQWERKSH